MGIWKDFCRTLEERSVIDLIGDRVAEIDTYALFEISDAQIFRAMDYVPTRLDEEESLLPPFPFPKLCLVNPGSIVAVNEPELDCDGKEVSFNVMLYWTLGTLSKPLLITGRVHVDATSLDEEGHLKYRIEDLVELNRDASLKWRRVWDEEEEKYARAEDLHRRHSMMKAKERATPEGLREIESTLEQLDRAVNESIELKKGYFDAIRDATLKITATSVQCIAWINQPNLYTVQVSPTVELSKKRKPQEKKLRRYAEREHYIMLDKDEIADAWHQTHRGGTHASPLPHLRRGHYKTLRAEKWKENRGKIIWVRATHVGGEVVEWRQGNTTYRVV